MSAASDLYFRQVPVGQMANFVYLIGSHATREALIVDPGSDADGIIEARGLKQVSDSGAIEALVDDVIANSPQQVDNYRNADDTKRPKMLGYFVGQIMKASKGQANPQQVNDVLLEKLNALL